MHPTLFAGTPFEVNTWKFFLFTGFIIVMALAAFKRPKGFPVGKPGIIFMFLLLLYFGLLGAKFLFLLLHGQLLPDGRTTFFIRFSRAGYAYLGALFFDLLAIAAFAKLRINRISFLKIADYIAPFLLLHLALVRIGCFLNGCCHGKSTDLPWGCVFLKFSPLPRHSTQLYSFIFLVFTFLLLRYIYKKGWPNGITFFSGLFLYGFFRFFVEFFRADSPAVAGPITLAQLSMLSLAYVSALSICIITAKNKELKRKCILLMFLVVPVLFFLLRNMPQEQAGYPLSAYQKQQIHPQIEIQVPTIKIPRPHIRPNIPRVPKIHKRIGK